MFGKKIKGLTKVILVLILLVPITFKVYDLYYSNANWDINSKVIKRGKTYRDYKKVKNKVGIPKVYFTYKKLTPEEMMTLDILSNTNGYNINDTILNVKSFVLAQHGKSLDSTLSKNESVEVDKYMDQIKSSVENNLKKNSKYIYGMKIILSVTTSLMIVMLIYNICMTAVFMKEK